MTKPRQAEGRSDSEPDIVLRAIGLDKSYPNRDWHLDVPCLEVPRGSLIVIRGHNGSGKSTLFRILGLVDREFDGYLEIDGQRVDEIDAAGVRDFRARHIGFVFQDDLLLPRLSLWENCELPARIQGQSSETKERLETFRDRFFSDVEDPVELLSRRRKHVSGGQRQRAAILRAVSHQPALILADEPTASLDVEAKQEVVEVFKDLCAETEATILVASHDDVFDGVGTTYELSKGRLETGQESAAGRDAPAPEGAHLRGSPFQLLTRIAWRETSGNPLFAAMVSIAVFAGLALLTMLWSVRTGTEKVLDDVISKGSRLDRLSVEVAAEQNADDGLPPPKVLDGLEVDVRTARRRDITLRVDDVRERERREIVYGLEVDDPELEKLELLAGDHFSEQDALAMLITQRSIERIVDPDADPEAAIGETVRVRLRRYASKTESEELSFDFVIQGIVDHAETARHLYLPQETLLAIATWQLDLEATLIQRGGRLEVATSKNTVAPRWDRLDLYFEQLADVVTASRYFVQEGFTTKTDLFRNRWVLETRRFVTWMILGILGVVLLMTGLLIVGNVFSSIRLERREIALLKLMGMKDRDVVSIFVLGVLGCTMVGGLAGLALGSILVGGLRERILAVYPDSVLGGVMATSSPSWWLTTLTSSLALSGILAFFAAQWTTRRDTPWNID